MGSFDWAGGHSFLRYIEKFFRRAVTSLLRTVRASARRVGTLNFITLHHAYFVITCLIFSAIFWAISREGEEVSYVNSLFLVVSAMTLTGLNTVNLSTVNTAQQLILYFLIIIGSHIWVSIFVIHLRKRAFERRFAHIAEMRRLRSQNSMRRRFSFSRSEPQGDTEKLTATRHSQRTDSNAATEPPVTLDLEAQSAAAQPEDPGPDRPPPTEEVPGAERANTMRPSTPDTVRQDTATRQRLSSDSQGTPGHITFRLADTARKQNPFLPSRGVGAYSNALVKQSSRTTSHESNPRTPTHASDAHSRHKGVFLTHSLTRNSQFHYLTEEERRQLGGYEYQAVRLLSWLVPLYFVLFQVLGTIGLGAYVVSKRPDTAYRNGLAPFWVGAFNAVSAFNNSGMSLLDANMVAFGSSVYMLLTMSLLILAGNTCYPIFLRLVIWTFHRLCPKSKQWDNFRHTLEFLLTHPRRCYTNLFPARHTWWLLCAVVVLNATDWIAFELLNLGHEPIESLPVGVRIIDGLFQAFAVRSGGFYVVPMLSVRISLQVLYVIMMYISVYPVVITMRNTNVYEERSLGIYADDPDYIADKDESAKRGLFARFLQTKTRVDETTQYFVRYQLRAQLSHDIWSIVAAVFLISAFEAGKFDSNPTVYSVFNIIFETVSAYGTVGISVGLADQDYSFSGALETVSKIVLCCVMIRGRHRGLPVAIDKAILLPREEVDEAEEDDALIRAERTNSRGRSV